MKLSSAHMLCLLWTLADAFVLHPELSRNGRSSSRLSAAPKRLDENVEGVVYVNEKCINCAACANFAPTVFQRSKQDHYHVVHHQPNLNDPAELDQARAALSACPVAAIRVETEAFRHHNKLPSLTEEDQLLASKMALSPKHNGLDLPFPRPLFGRDDVFFVGSHNEGSFGAIPYLTRVNRNDETVWIMVDTPRFSKAAVQVVTSLTGPAGPQYIVLTHIDDTDGHNQWVEEFPSLQRIFHAGDLGRYNWLNDKTLENVEILLPNNDQGDSPLSLAAFDLDGRELTTPEQVQHEPVVVYHTPGHSPGSISLHKPPSGGRSGVLFTGDTYAFTTRTNTMSGFPRYNKDGLKRQAKTVEVLVNELDWDVVAPGHGFPRDYTNESTATKKMEMQDTLNELRNYRQW